MGQLFGTDGIRGVANQYPMTPEMALRIGRVVAAFFKTTETDSKIILGKDTRISGDMIESALVAGICATGAEVRLAGVLPTPGVAFLCRNMGASAGFVISASHNPFYDNGIKIFKGDGFKLSDAEEGKIEAMLKGGQQPEPSSGETLQDTGRVKRLVDAGKRYRSFLRSLMPDDFSLDGLRIVVDCANGATHDVAPRLMKELGADLEVCSAQPDGKNINQNCGSQHPEGVQELVRRHHADLGLAFDGDGDRLIAVDERGAIVTGDQIMAVCAGFMKENGQLKNNRVVTTVMSNMGLHIALAKMGIEHDTTRVGDRYVMEQMVRSGAVLGGEDSGHLLFMERHTTGDGLLAALKLLEILTETGRHLSDLVSVMTVFPQQLVNVEVSRKPPIETVPEIVHAIDQAQAQLGGEGRVLVRYSGTQPVCRVMVEAPTSALTDRHCRQIAGVIREQLG